MSKNIFYIGTIVFLFTFISCSKSDDTGFDKPTLNNSMESFSIFEDVGRIENTNIYIDLPYGTDLTKIKPKIKVSYGSMVTPASGEEVDLSTPFKYIVNKNDKKIQYTVIATLTENSVAEITSFRFQSFNPVVEGVIDGRDISVLVPIGTDLSALVPTIDYKGVSMSPESNTAQDFNWYKKLNYAVTAKDGTVRTYLVKVTVDEPRIDSLSSKDLKPGEEFFMYGYYPSSETYSYELGLNAYKSKIKILEQTSTYVKAIVPLMNDNKNYYIYIKYGKKSVPQFLNIDYTSPINVTLQSLSSYAFLPYQYVSFNLYGQNFKYDGAQTKVYITKNDWDYFLGQEVTVTSADDPIHVSYSSLTPGDYSVHVVVVKGQNEEVTDNAVYQRSNSLQFTVLE